MSAIFKYFTTVIFAVASTICSADTFTFNYYYPPGGGTDLHHSWGQRYRDRADHWSRHHVGAA